MKKLVMTICLACIAILVMGAKCDNNNRYARAIETMHIKLCFIPVEIPMTIPRKDTQLDRVIFVPDGNVGWERFVGLVPYADFQYDIVFIQYLSDPPEEIKLKNILVEWDVIEHRGSNGKPGGPGDRYPDKIRLPNRIRSGEDGLRAIVACVDWLGNIHTDLRTRQYIRGLEDLESFPGCTFFGTADEIYGNKYHTDNFMLSGQRVWASASSAMAASTAMEGEEGKICFVLGEPPLDPHHPAEAIIYEDGNYIAIPFEDAKIILEQLTYSNDANIVSGIRWRVDGKDTNNIVGQPLFAADDPADEYGRVSFDTINDIEPNFIENCSRYDVVIDVNCELPVGVKHKGLVITGFTDSNDEPCPALIAPLMFTTVDSNTVVSDGFVLIQWGFSAKKFALGQPESSDGKKITVTTLLWGEGWVSVVVLKDPGRDFAKFAEHWGVVDFNDFKKFVEL